MASGEEYSGDWADGERHGHGKCVYPGRKEEEEEEEEEEEGEEDDDDDSDEELMKRR